MKTEQETRIHLVAVLQSIYDNLSKDEICEFKHNQLQGQKDALEYILNGSLLT